MLEVQPTQPIRAVASNFLNHGNKPSQRPAHLRHSRWLTLLAPQCHHEVSATPSPTVNHKALPPEFTPNPNHSRPSSPKEIDMTVTDYVGVAGLVAAALLALWMLLGATSPFHRGNSTPTTPTPPRHRGAPTGNLLNRLFR
jgi:hypothetical protein